MKQVVFFLKYFLWEHSHFYGNVPNVPTLHFKLLYSKTTIHFYFSTKFRSLLNVSLDSTAAITVTVIIIIAAIQPPV